MKKLNEFIKPFVIALALTVGISIASAAWTGPTVAPPGGNVDAPINTGDVSQSKKGGLIIQGLNSLNQAITNSLLIINGRVGIGTANPSEKLHVVGGRIFADDVCLNDGSKCLSTLTGGAPAPSLPTSRGFTSFGGFSSAISVSSASGKAYLASSWRLDSIDISSPDSPSTWGFAKYGDYGVYITKYNPNVVHSYQPRKSFLSGNFLYDAMDNGLFKTDISNPSNPVYVNPVAIVNGVNRPSPAVATVSGNYFYQISWDNLKLEVYDASKTYNFSSQLVKTFTLSISAPTSISASGNLVFVMGNIAGKFAVQIIDVADPTSPVSKSISSWNNLVACPPSTLSSLVSGNYLFTLASSCMNVINISNPLSPIVALKYASGTGGSNFTSANDMVIGGQNLYLYGDGIEILNITNPTSPSHQATLSYSTSLLSPAHFLAVSGNYIYVTSDNARPNTFYVYDISNPTQPIKKSTYVNTSGNYVSELKNVSGIFVRGNYLYLMTYGATEVFDISNPALPIKVSRLADRIGGMKFAGSSGNKDAIYISGPLRYIASPGSQSLQLFDYRGNGDDVYVGSLTNGTGGAFLPEPVSVVASGNYAYVANGGDFGEGGLEVVEIMRDPNVTDKIKMTHKGTIKNGDGGAVFYYPTRVFVSGNYVYVINSSQGSGISVQVVDVSNPSSPTHIGRLSNIITGGPLPNSSDSFILGNYIYIVVPGSLVVVDISTPASPRLVGRLNNGVEGAFLTNPTSVFVSGNYAFVTDAGSNALEVVNVTNPAQPKHYTVVKNGDGGAKFTSPKAVYVANNYAYILSNDGLQILGVGSILGPSASNGTGASNVAGVAGSLLSSRGNVKCQVKDQGQFNDLVTGVVSQKIIELVCTTK